MVVKIGIIAVFFLVTLAVGIICRGKSGSVGDFVLGGRGIGPWLTAFAYGTSYFSAVVFVGYAGQFGYSFGVAATWIGIGNALIGSLLAWLVMGRRTRVMTKHLKSATMPDFFAQRFNSNSLRIGASIVIFVMLIPYSASVYKGLSGLFAMAFGIDFIYCILGMAVLTAVYVIVGGYTATAVNDFIQGIIMLVGIVAVILAVLGENGGFKASLALLSQVPAPQQPDLQGAYASFFGPDPIGLLSVVILTSVGALGLPQMIHKFYTIKNEQAIKTGAVISALFALVIAGGSYFLGAFGRLFYTVDGKIVFDDIVPQMLSGTLSDLLMGVVIVLVLSASMSTLSSLVITSSSTFTLDFLKGLFFKNMSSKTQLITIKLLCGAFVTLSVILALIPNALITTLMSISWGALSGAFLGPFLYGLFWKGATKASVWACILISLGLTLGNSLFPVTTPTIAGATTIMLSLVIVPLVSLLTPKLNKAHIDSVFSCYDEKVMVAHKLSLDEIEE